MAVAVRLEAAEPQLVVDDGADDGAGMPAGEVSDTDPAKGTVSGCSFATRERACCCRHRLQVWR
jgi:hypothetical protein